MANLASPIVRVFIRGIVGGAWTSLSVVSSDIRTSTIRVVFGGDVDSVQRVEVSYLLLQLNNPHFAAYGGVAQLEEHIYKAMDLRRGFSALQNPFMGLYHISASPTTSFLAHLHSQSFAL